MQNQSEERSLTPQQKPYPPPQNPYPPPPVRQGRGCFSTCATFGGVILVILTAALAIMLVAFTSDITNFGEGIFEVLGLLDPEDEPQVVEKTTIVLGIRELAVLETIRSDILIEHEVSKDKGPLLRDALLTMRYTGRVTAGVNLAGITDESVVIDEDNVITVTMPPAQITGCYLTNPTILSSRCGDNINPFGGSGCDDDISEMQEVAYREGLKDLYDVAIEQRLTVLSIAEAQGAVADLLNSFGFSEVRFELSTEELPPDESCVAG